MRSSCAVKPLLTLPKVFNLSSKTYYLKSKCAPQCRFETALCEDRQRVLTFMRHHFYREEPLRIGASPITTDVNDENFHLANIQRSTCVLALKPDDTIIAAIIGACKVPYQLDHIAERYGGKWGNILKIWAKADKESNVFKRFRTNRSLHAYLVAVHRNYRNYGLCTRMIRELGALGRKQKYEMVTIDATNVHVACACKRLGMILVNTLAYGSHMDDKGVPIFAPPRPHDAIRSYVLRL